MTSFFYDSYQLILFFLAPGIFLGAIYDVFRILRIARSHSKGSVIPLLYAHFGLSRAARVQTEKRKQQIEYALVMAEDIFFCLFAAATEILLFYHLNSGVIRIYGLLLSAVGFFLYRLSLGKLVIHMAKQIIDWIRRLLYVLLLVILTPAVWIYRKSHTLVKHAKHTRAEKKKNKKEG